MGTFIGHAIPGSAFFVYGLLQAFALTRLFFDVQNAKGWQYKGRDYLTLRVGARELPIEGVYIMVAAALGTLAEVLTLTKEAVRLTHYQHITMYLAFFVAGLFQLLHASGCRMPWKLPRCLIILAFCIEGMLFAFHLHGRVLLDVTVHQVLMYSLAAAIVVSCVELLAEPSLTMSLVRAFTYLLHGSWFWQIGFILYPPPGCPVWGRDEKSVFMTVALAFCADCFICLFIMASVWCAIGCRARAIFTTEKLQHSLVEDSEPLLDSVQTD